MTFDEAITTIRKDIEEDKNWRSARQKMHDVLNAALEAQHEVQSLASKRALLEVLTAKEAALQRSIDERQAQLSCCDADIAAKEQRAQHRLDELDAQIKVKEQRLAEADAKLHRLRTHLSA